MKSILCPILSLVVCSVFLFGSTEAGDTGSMNTTILPTPYISINVSNTVHFSHHNSTLYTNLTSAMIMSTAHANASSHNSTLHPTLSPSPSASLNHSIFTNISSTTAQNASHMSSHIVPTYSISPSAMTSILPTTSVAPSPRPPPQVKYSVKNKNGTVCLLFWLSLKLTINYKSSGGKEKHVDEVMPSSGHSDGSCSGSLSSINIQWSFYSVEATFSTAKKSNGHWTTTNITITAKTSNNTKFVDANVTQIKQSVGSPSELDWLSGEVDKSLNCSQSKKVNVGSILATLDDVQIQPFEVENGIFNEANFCNPKPTKAPPKKNKKKNNDTVAIAVGCSLGGLVLIVLIGYFIGKRRSRSSTGYRKL